MSKKCCRPRGIQADLCLVSLWLWGILLLSPELSNAEEPATLNIFKGSVTLIRSGLQRQLTGPLKLVLYGRERNIPMKTHLLIEDVLIADDTSVAIVVCDDGAKKLEHGKRTDVRSICKRRVNNPQRALIQAAYESPVDENSTAAIKGDHEQRKRLHIFFPTDGTKLLTSTPSFAWNDSTTTYKMEVFQNRELVWRLRIHNRSRIPFPNDQPPLVPGEYNWQITEMDGTGNDEAKFVIVEPAEREQVMREKQIIESEMISDDISKKARSLVLAGFFRRKGFQYEAVQVVENALRMSPDDPELRFALEQVLRDRE